MFMTSSHSLQKLWPMWQIIQITSWVYVSGVKANTVSVIKWKNLLVAKNYCMDRGYSSLEVYNTSWKIRHSLKVIVLCGSIQYFNKYYIKVIIFKFSVYFAVNYHIYFQLHQTVITFPRNNILFIYIQRRSLD